MPDKPENNKAEYEASDAAAEDTTGAPAPDNAAPARKRAGAPVAPAPAAAPQKPTGYMPPPEPAPASRKKAASAPKAEPDQPAKAQAKPKVYKANGKKHAGLHISPRKQPMIDTGGEVGEKTTAGGGLVAFGRTIGARLFKPERAVFTIGLTVALVIIIVIVVYFVTQIGTYTIREPIYRYDTSLKLEYEGTTKIRRRDNIITLENNGEQQTLDGSPLYFSEDANRLLAPNMMIIVQPGQIVPPARTPYYTTLQYDSGSFSLLENDKQLNTLSSGFLFDGSNLYLFLEPMTVRWQGMELEMPAMSYAIVHYNVRIELYPAGGEPVVQQTGESLVVAYNSANTFQIDLSKDILNTADGDTLLFTDPSLLDEITATWPTPAE